MYFALNIECLLEKGWKPAKWVFNSERIRTKTVHRITYHLNWKTNQNETNYQTIKQIVYAGKCIKRMGIGKNVSFSQLINLFRATQLQI